MSNEAQFNMTQAYRELGGPLIASIAGGAAPYAPTVDKNNHVNEIELPAWSVWEVKSKRGTLYESGGGERARVVLKDAVGNEYDSLLLVGVGQTVEQSESPPLANKIVIDDNPLKLSLHVDRANPDPIEVSAQWVFKLMTRDPADVEVQHN